MQLILEEGFPIPVREPLRESREDLLNMCHESALCTFYEKTNVSTKEIENKVEIYNIQAVMEKYKINMEIESLRLDTYKKILKMRKNGENPDEPLILSEIEKTLDQLMEKFNSIKRINIWDGYEQSCSSEDYCIVIE